ncbi:hypothetical protein D9756_004378 [Leucocoprinus leucothites]|uniref:Uncharacterized protein n=1 Tax=Leucocoprinus leucothites TaxID=201217 RepID=A0A8H5D9C4_9AGAR|nr:hypothetical protein D9756_004378 [Leucoagaricus leucothites]
MGLQPEGRADTLHKQKNIGRSLEPQSPFLSSPLAFVLVANSPPTDRAMPPSCLVMSHLPKRTRSRLSSADHHDHQVVGHHTQFTNDASRAIIVDRAISAGGVKGRLPLGPFDD